MGSSQSNKTYIRYAPYIEEKHEAFLDEIVTRRDAAIDSSPYSGYSIDDPDLGFFGTGYAISNFPSLYDMYGKFMAGLDVEVLFDQIFTDSTTGNLIDNVTSAQADLLDDELNQSTLPRFRAGMRDINAVVSSSFLTGQSIIESNRLNTLSKFDAELRYRMMAVAVERWRSHLDWNKNVIVMFYDMNKLYYTIRLDVDEHEYSMNARDTLWPFTVLDFERAALGALQGARTTGGVAGASPLQKALAGAMSGASLGATVGSALAAPGAAVNPLWAVGGAILGFGSGFL